MFRMSSSAISVPIEISAASLTCKTDYEETISSYLLMLTFSSTSSASMSDRSVSPACSLVPINFTVFTKAILSVMILLNSGKCQPYHSRHLNYQQINISSTQLKLNCNITSLCSCSAPCPNHPRATPLERSWYLLYQGRISTYTWTKSGLNPKPWQTFLCGKCPISNCPVETECSASNAGQMYLPDIAVQTSPL